MRFFFLRFINKTINDAHVLFFVFGCISVRINFFVILLSLNHLTPNLSHQTPESLLAPRPDGHSVSNGGMSAASLQSACVHVYGILPVSDGDRPDQ